jgi:hypothetical protein
VDIREMYWPCGVPQIFAHNVVGPSIIVEPEDSAPSDSPNGTLHTNGNGKPISDGRGSEQEPDKDVGSDADIIDMKVARTEQIFATVSSDTLNIWSIRPTAVLASLRRSGKSLSNYGKNDGVHFRPDGSLVVLHTNLGFLILYAVDNESGARVFQQRTQESQTRKQSVARTFGTSDSSGLPEIALRFRKIIKIDAGIKSIIALDQDLIVATAKPPAIQCIRWETQKGLHQTSTQLLGKMSWIERKASIVYMVHDRAMNLSVWLDADGSAYAVRRVRPQVIHRPSSEESSQSSASSIQPATKLFDGYKFHSSSEAGGMATLLAHRSGYERRKNPLLCCQRLRRQHSTLTYI